MKDGASLPGWPLLLRRDLAAAYVAMSESTFDAGWKAGQLPQPVPTLGTLKAWHRRELEAWVEDCAAKRKEVEFASDPNPFDED